ncbi:MAG: 8-amino-7-oxononanoate synthase [Muribaculum sp.]|nr:8-amino-7-oxononanoate synthase [Muribaculum sp.]
MKIFEDYLDSLRKEDRLRQIPRQGKPRMIDLLSNDYLGLALNGRIYREEFLQRFGDAAFTSSASRLLQREQKYHVMLEQKLAELYSRSALLFNSGYHANVGAMSALASLPGTLIISDKLIHASAIDGIRMGHADVRRCPHNDTAALRKILSRHADDYNLVVIVVESVYSMDGDLTDLNTLVSLKNEFPNVILYVDEAHGFGVFGDRGLGLAEQENLIDRIDIIVGTLGKAAASAGAFIIASQEIIDFLLNSARSFIFSTALSPAQQAWSILMLEKIVDMRDQRVRLAKLSYEFTKQLENITNQPINSRSQIIPLIAGSAPKAMEWATALRKEGFDSLPIRRPTVAPGTERIRFSLNAAIKDDDMERLFNVLKDIVK